MALSLFAVLRRRGAVDPDAFATSLVQRYERQRGYGRSIRALVERVRAGAHWREAARQLFGETGSYGNGCASRVPPVGAFFANDLATAAEQAARSAVVTHAHPEALAGAAAVAVAAAWAWQLRDLPSIAPGDFLDRVAQHVPVSAVRTGMLHARDLAPTTPAKAASLLGNGSDAAVQHCALRPLVRRPAAR